jgi:hypothetical protein
MWDEFSTTGVGKGWRNGNSKTKQNETNRNAIFAPKTANQT